MLRVEYWRIQIKKSKYLTEVLFLRNLRVDSFDILNLGGAIFFSFTDLKNPYLDSQSRAAWNHRRLGLRSLKNSTREFRAL